MAFLVNTAGGFQFGPLTTTPVDGTGATLVVIAVNCDAVPGVTDSLGSTVVPFVAQSGVAGGHLAAWYILNPVGIGPGYTITFDGSGSFGSYTVDLFSAQGGGIGPTITSASAAFGATTLQPGSITPAQNGSLLWTFTGGQSDVGEANVVSISSPFAITGSVVDKPGNWPPIGSGSHTQAALATENPTWTYQSFGTGAWAFMAEFKGSGGGGGGGRGTLGLLGVG